MLALGDRVVNGWGWFQERRRNAPARFSSAQPSPHSMSGSPTNTNTTNTHRHPTLLSCGRRHSSVEAHATVLRALGGPALLELLARSVVGHEDGDAACRCLAGAALEEALVALQQLDSLPGQEVRAVWGWGMGVGVGGR